MEISREFSSSEESDGSNENKKFNKNTNSEHKNKIVRNIFLNVSKSDNGAKGKDKRTNNFTPRPK